MKEVTKMKKKYALIAAVMCAVVSMSACGDKKTSSGKVVPAETQATTEASSVETAPETDPVEEDSQAASVTGNGEYVSDELKELRDKAFKEDTTLSMYTCKASVTIPKGWFPYNTVVQDNALNGFPALFMYNDPKNIITIQVMDGSADKATFDAYKEDDLFEQYTSSFTNVEKLGFEKLDISGNTAYKMKFKGIGKNDEGELADPVTATYLFVNSVEEGRGYFISLMSYNSGCEDVSENIQNMISFPD